MVKFSDLKIKNLKNVILISLCVIFVFTSCSSSKESNSQKSNSGNQQVVGDVKYEKCGNFLCATIKVPLDYKKPKGKKIDIAIRTLSAGIPSKKKGILLINPGGPGGSGVDFVESASGIISQVVLDEFDIVGWDPRGVGQSSKLKCTAYNLDFLFDDIDYSPDDEAELSALEDVNKKIGEDCVEDNPDLAKHLNSKDATRDMDEIRKSLGEKQLNYLGFSYGTVLGQLYATMFPKNYRAMVIDGVVDVGENPLESAGNQGIGFEKAFDSFFEYCREVTCKYSKDQDPKAVYAQLSKQVDATPIKTQDLVESYVGPAQFDLGTGVYMYGGRESWPSLDDALTALQSGETSGIMLGYNSYLGRSGSGIYDGSYASFLSILCADGKLASGEDLYAYGKSIAEKAPLFGEAVVLLGAQCSFWPNATDAKAFKVNNSKGNNIMIIGTTGDPATPVQASRDVAKKLQNSSYVEFKGEGHTAYGRSNACVDNTINSYFIDLKSPKSNTYC